MAEAHSEQKGSRPLIAFSERYTESYVDDAGEAHYHRGVRVCVDLPQDFDFTARGKQLLQRIESAARLFCAEAP